MKNSPDEPGFKLEQCLSMPSSPTRPHPNLPRLTSFSEFPLLSHSHLPAPSNGCQKAPACLHMKQRTCKGRAALGRELLTVRVFQGHAWILSEDPKKQGVPHLGCFTFRSGKGVEPKTSTGRWEPEAGLGAGRTGHLSRAAPPCSRQPHVRERSAATGTEWGPRVWL